jgi:hypothetical protein
MSEVAKRHLSFSPFRLYNLVAVQLEELWALLRGLAEITGR